MFRGLFESQERWVGRRLGHGTCVHIVRRDGQGPHDALAQEVDTLHGMVGFGGAKGLDGEDQVPGGHIDDLPLVVKLAAPGIEGPGDEDADLEHLGDLPVGGALVPVNQSLENEVGGDHPHLVGPAQAVCDGMGGRGPDIVEVGVSGEVLQGKDGDPV